MSKIIGVRREDKNKWEIRVPITPSAVKEIKEKYGIETIVQPYPKRAFSDESFINNGALISDDLSNCNTIFAVKEIPISLLMKEKTYLFFSHTLKGQKYNMPLLQKVIDQNITLIDYECIKDNNGKRLVFFGRFAGLAGMIDALHGLGIRLKELGIDNQFLKIKPAYEYTDLQLAKDAIKAMGEKIANEGFAGLDFPLVFAFSGYGNVSNGAQEIFDLLPHTVLKPDELLLETKELKTGFYKVVFEEKDMVKPIDQNSSFNLNDYYKNPQKYQSKFEDYLPKINVLINAIYWDEKYPRLVTKEYLRNNDISKFYLISDISCDIDGAIEITYKSTKPDEPSYVYNPISDTYQDGYIGEGIVNMAVDNLPCELAKDASVTFSDSLLPFINEIANCDFTKEFDNLELPDSIKNAIIVLHGKLTPNFLYLQKFL